MNETGKMSEISGLPKPGSYVTVHITRVHVHPLCELVEFWGKFREDRKEAHQQLATDIQLPEKPFDRFEGNPGDQCLVQISDTWYRSRIVSRNGSECNVFLIDRGLSYSTTTNMLAWGKKEHFYLPPEVEYCVLANVLPLSPENRWSPVALEFMRRLSGKSAMAFVQDVLVTQRTIFLHVPCISKQMCEMGLAKFVSMDRFHTFVQKLLHSGGSVTVFPGTLQNYSQKNTVGADEKMHKQQLFLHPELSTETLETVIITEVTNPQRIFCQLKVFSPELKKLSEQMTQCYEDRLTNSTVGHTMIGLPCAARGNDGRWYRSVIQQVLPPKKVVEVLNVDYGTKRLVQVDHVKPLAAEFFRMPVVTYNCSLHGIIDRGVGWNRTLIDYLKHLILHKTLLAKFEYQSQSEGVHYVSLYGDQNININNLFASNVDCLLERGKSLEDLAIPSSAYSHQHTAAQERQTLTYGQAKDNKEKQELLQAEVLTVNTSYVAVVQHVLNPSEFWIQIEKNTNVLDKLMDGMFHLYRDSLSQYRVRSPAVGLYCAAKAKDGDFYRVTVCEVGETQVKVFFVDYGNTEVVGRSDIRTLPDEFKLQPWLSVKCKLANIRPKDGDWSHSASQRFTEAVTDKVLNVHVTGKHDDCYDIKLTDAEPLGERDVGELMCSLGFAECDDTQRQLETKMWMEPATTSAAQNPDTTLGLCRNSEASFQTQNTAEVNHFEVKTMFEEPLFPIGSVLDVNVSFIESPNDFWCQLVQNAWHLKLLMRDIQAHYADSEFEPFVEKACVARFPANGMWYRGLIIKDREKSHVDVRFVDYGHTETVSIYDLRKIITEFMTLKGQAFRCSLLNPLDKSSANNDWSPEAIAKFHDFVNSAASAHGILKCTIYAILYTQQVIFNLVDLETPFENIGSILAKLMKCVSPRKAPQESFHLDTYYYSAHGVKTGTDEQVTVTFVKSVCHFYCQLSRNANMLEDLKKKVNSLCSQLKNISPPEVETLCFAKYSDDQWYRGQIMSRKPAILVHFVDYGDTVEVNMTDLLPIPKEAADIISVPPQAVVCCLSDVPANVPSEANSWFERNVTECKFRALVVAREPDGKLVVELYQGNEQINSKINKMFQIEVHNEKGVVYRGRRASEASANNAQRVPKAVPKQRDTMSRNCKTGQQVRSALELYRPPRRRSGTAHEMEGDPKSADAHSKQIKLSHSTGSNQLMNSNVADPDSQTDTFVTPEASVETLPKVADLPEKCVTSGMEVDVFISHCDSPLSFYVQFVSEETEIVSLVEKLNDSQSTQKPVGEDVQPGDLVQAEFPDDFSWYRAAVREIQGSSMALVEFIDYGNTTVIPLSKICELQEAFLRVPRYSTHCKLSDAAALERKVLDPEFVSAFKRDIGDNAEKVLKCRFVGQSGSQWEVSLEDEGVNITCKVPAVSLAFSEEECFQNSDSKRIQENLQPTSPYYQEQEFPEGQELEVYIVAVDDGLTFWCQSADINALEIIVSEVGNAADYKKVDLNTLSPGSPCIARYAEDELWYRAEVIDKGEGNLSVLFVDYGNKSEVKMEDVREMSPELVETSPQAFLCELEGFGSSDGFWDNAAVDELSALTDRLFHLTVCRVTTAGGKTKYSVRLECEGEVINESLKHRWKTSVTENCPDTGEPAPSSGTTESNAVLGKPQPSDESKVSAAEDDEEQSERLCTDELVEGHTADEMHGDADGLNSDDSVDSGRYKSCTEIPEEGVDHHVQPCDSDMNVVLSQPDEEQDRGVLCSSCDEYMETDECISVRDAEPDDLKSSPVKENDREAVTPFGNEIPQTCSIIAGAPESTPADDPALEDDVHEDEYEIAPSELEAMLEDVSTHNPGGNDDITSDSEPNVDMTDTAADISVSSQTSVVSSEAVGHTENIDLDQTTELNAENWKVESIQPSSVTPIQELLASEQHSDTFLSADTRAVFEEDSWPAEEACFTDVGTELTREDDTGVTEQISTQNKVADGGGDYGGATCHTDAEACLNPQRDDVANATDESLIMEAEELVPNDSPLPFNVIHLGEIESHSEHQMKIEENLSFAASLDESDRVSEEETSALCDDEASDLWQSSFDSISAELISDKLQTAETLVSKELNDGVCVEQMLPADDSLAAHLSNATHLCLLIMDRCAEVPQRRPEE